MDYENGAYGNEQNEVISLGNWIITLIVLAIPLVGLIMTCVWGFSGNTPKSKANYCKAVLIFYIIGIVLACIFYGSIIALFGAAGYYDTMNALFIV